MKTSGSSRRAFSHPTIWLLATFCLGVGALVYTLYSTGNAAAAQGQSSGPAAHGRQLSLIDRVAYQRAIEEVYWRHQVWPDTNKNPKPLFDQAMSPTQLEKKVTDYLRNSQALEDYWHRPITAEQLQAEMDRMARQSKKSEMLRELFAALGNDPFIIAECLARPILAERLTTHFYALDERFHGDLKRRAETDLQSHPSVTQGRQTSGTYHEIEWVKDEGDQNGPDRNAATGMKIESREWPGKIERLEATLGTSRSGTFSSLQEDEQRFYAIGLIEKTSDHVKFGTIEWFKDPFESWIAKAESQTPSALLAPVSDYRLPPLSEMSSSTDDTWTSMMTTLTDRYSHTAVWTGSEMIVWGGYDGSTTNTGGRYNPVTDTWMPTSILNAPTARGGHLAVWTGSEMIVWGGGFNTGGRYNPLTDSWMPAATTGAPSASGQTAIWTGSEMIVWGGDANSGGRYNPVTDFWTPTSTTNEPTVRGGHTAIWTGTEMIVWSGSVGQDFTNTGGRYDPVTDTWTTTNTTNAPAGRFFHTAVWTGSEMIVWGGLSNANARIGGRYDPVTDSWTLTSSVNVPEALFGHKAVWTGSEMIVWGGRSFSDQHTGAGRYDPATDTWSSPSAINAPTARYYHTAIWTGSEMIVWGGYGFDNNSHPQAVHGLWKYKPDEDSWVVSGDGPAQGSNSTSVWTGSEMIVWGGLDFFGNASNSGGRYFPSTDTWTGTALLNVPAYRFSHTAVWTGTEMIVWGGGSVDGIMVARNTGGKYNPLTNSWTSTSNTDSPSHRFSHTAVWTGSEMIVWGGYSTGQSNSYDTGGRYDPQTDAWTPTAETAAPAAQAGHVSVWTGSEMIVWGGGSNTGGKYNPSTDSWTSMNTTGSVSGVTAWTGNEMIIWNGLSGGRYNPSLDVWVAINALGAPPSGATAVWTGSEMIVWGGSSNAGGRYHLLTDSWRPTSTINAPSTRSGNVAVWTGSEMIIWGGGYYDGGPHYQNTGGRYFALPPATPTPAPSATPFGDPTPTPTPDPSSTPPPTFSITGTVDYCSDAALGPLPNVTLNLVGGPASTTLSDSSGSYAFSGLTAGGTYIVTPSKDAMPPASPVINTLDAMAVQRHYLTEMSLTGCPLSAADVNGNMIVDTQDVLGIQRFFIGRTFGTGNVGHYQFNPASRTYPAISADQTGQDYDALVIGDVISPAARP